MLRIVTTMTLLAALANAAGGCGYSDAHNTFMPEALRYKAPEPKPEIIPDIKAVMRDKGSEVFSTRSPPRNIRVSQPRRNPSGSGWTSCVRADVAGITGRSIGTKTYLLTIDSNNRIGDRRLVDGSSECASENYEPV